MKDLLRTHTYPDVAREIAEGLESGEIAFEGEDEVERDLGLLSFVLFRFLSPTMLNYVASTSQLPAREHRLAFEVAREAIEDLPDKMRNDLVACVGRLREKGVVVEIKDRDGAEIDAGRLAGSVASG